jgi:hypothetical protein
MRHLFLLFLLMTGFPIALSTDSPAACLASSREVKFPDGSARMKAYSCSLTDSSEPVLQVEFDRLSEAAAGSLVEGSHGRDFQKLYGKLTVLQNAVFSEAKYLFDKFGARGVSEDCFHLTLSSAEARGSYSTEQGVPNHSCSDKRTTTLWYFTEPDWHHSGLPFPADWGPKVTNQSWPPGWKFFYNDCDMDSGTDPEHKPCVYLWRSVSIDELDTEVQHLKQYLNKPVGERPISASVPDRKYFDLIKYVAKGSLPEDFMILLLRLRCDCDEQTGLQIRNFRLHTAFIRNISNKTITIDGLIAGSDERESLRVYVDGQKPKLANDTLIDQIVLSPGETFAIPLRMNFVPSEIWNTLGDTLSAGKAFELIQHNPSEMIKELDCADGRLKSVRRDSFGAPTVPAKRIYSYGPAITLQGVSISRTQVKFDKPLSNFVLVEVGEPTGSCPYVYAYDEHRGEWVRHGKIIDNASAREKETTQRIEQDGLARKFKISEEEMEVTFLRRVRLELALADGRFVTLMPKHRLRPEARNHYDKIEPGAEREYDFDLPDSLLGASVRKSTLVVTGYYLRRSGVAFGTEETGR